MNWRLIKPFTFSLLFASQTRRHGRIFNILGFCCIRGKPLFYDAKYWYKLCIKWLATNCSALSVSGSVAGHSPGKVPKTFSSGFCICYWVSRCEEACRSPMFSEGRKTLNSCAQVPGAAGLLADGASQDQSWNLLWETGVWSRGLLWVWELGPWGCECWQGCWGKAGAGTSLCMGTLTCPSWWRYLFAKHPSPAPVLLGVVAWGLLCFKHGSFLGRPEYIFLCCLSIGGQDWFSVLAFTCRFEALEQVMGNYGLCCCPPSFSLCTLIFTFHIF